jgi:hypothetical protein
MIIVRLGRRGNMTRVEAVNDLRSPTQKSTELGRNGTRPKVSLVCDFADQVGNTTTEQFPIEIEAGPDLSNTIMTLCEIAAALDARGVSTPRAGQRYAA